MSSAKCTETPWGTSPSTPTPPSTRPGAPWTRPSTPTAWAVHRPSPDAPPAPGASDPNAGATINYYNSAGPLTATTDALGNTAAFSYTSGGSGVPNNLLYSAVDPVDYQASVTCPAYGASHVTAQ